MLITLIRDNIPAKAEAEGVKLNATIAQNDDLYANLLNERLIDAAGVYLSSGNLEALVETQVIVDSLADLLGDRYKEIYNKQMEELGTYSNRYMLVQMQSSTPRAAAQPAPESVPAESAPTEATPVTENDQV
jgi:predicted house-cleaning noncanonical NTP pyrophosphatase (MazG superfamily)